LNPKLSIIIPCYNEEKNIPILLERLNDIVENYMEVIVVDNGSTDNTKTLLVDLINKINNPSIKSIRVKKNIGYGHGIMEGLCSAEGQIVSWTHADLQTDIYDVIIGFKKLMKHNNVNRKMVKGKRRNRPLIDLILTYTMSIVSSFILRQSLSDINAQPKIFHRDLLKKMNNPPNDFSLDLYLLNIAKINKIEILEIPVYFNERLYGEASGGGGSSFKTKMELISKTFSYIIQIRENVIK
jgi:glycosyltransferase involved in cell wall biosynthesis